MGVAYQISHSAACMATPALLHHRCTSLTPTSLTSAPSKPDTSSSSISAMALQAHKSLGVPALAASRRATYASSLPSTISSMISSTDRVRADSIHPSMSTSVGRSVPPNDDERAAPSAIFASSRQLCTEQTFIRTEIHFFMSDSDGSNGVGAEPNPSRIHSASSSSSSSVGVTSAQESSPGVVDSSRPVTVLTAVGSPPKRARAALAALSLALARS
mmetsp:Transcript_39480/g.81035  ORF Transcript_39480/g.81035 Transcript_39480/m.81035 type:complete len:216 (+) Transcript_39480:4625-5272(+)